MRDKAIHFIAGFAISAPLAWMGYPVTGVLLAGFAGIAKEVWDYRGNGTPELADFIATMIGAVFIVLAVALT